MKQRLRGPLIAALVLALVATLGGMEALRRHEPDRSSTASAGEDDGFLDRLGRAARGLVGGGRDRVRPEEIVAGLRLDQKPKPGVVKKPAKRVKELTGRRTATTRVFAMSDGRLQAEVSAAPRFYRDGKGAWRPIDTTVSPSRVGGFAAANTSNTFTSRFGASTAALARFELDGQQVTLGLAGASRKVTPKVDGNTVTYAGIASGVDVSYDVTATALKERLVLGSAAAASAMTFTMDAGTLKVAQREDGSIEFRSPGDNRVLLVMPAPFMYDAKAEASSPYGYAYSTKVTQALRADGGRWAIDVTADKGWLADPKRVWPVTVDPTIKVQPAKDQAQDAMIVSDGPSSNYGSTWNLSVGTTDLAAARSLVKFDLSTIPANTTIDSASLQMYYDQIHTTGAYDVPIEVREVTQAWDEATVTWNSINDKIGSGAATVVMVDDIDADKIAMVGSWPNSTSTIVKDGINGTYRYNKDTVAGDTFTWTPTLPEDGTYTVEEHHVPYSDRSTAADFTVTYDGGSKLTKVNQQQPANADWATLGTYPFKAGTAAKVVLSDATVTSKVAVIADAVRFTKAGGVKRANEANVWNTFPATNLVQKWLNDPTTNFGFMLKAVDEARLGHGGPRYEAAEDAYNGETENAPKLIVNYGNPGVVVDTPRTLYPTGAALRWSQYPGSDIAEYQVHRSTSPNFTPSAATLIAPVSTGVRSYTDTTATPTPATSTDPYGQVYYYQVAVKTTGGAVVPSTAVVAKLPKSGQVVQTIQASGDATISSKLSTTNLNTLGGKPLVNVGNNSVDYAYTRALLRFDTSSIPSNARLLSSSLNLWSSGSIFDTSQHSNYNVHALTKPFDPATVTWQKADSTTTWTSGGDYNPTVVAYLGNFGQDDPPQWRRWTVKDAVQSWINGTATNNGFLIKHSDEGGRLKENTSFLATEGTDAMRPQLQVVYTVPDAAQTYHAPATPTLMTSDGTYSVPVTLSNPTESTTWTAADWVLSYRWVPTGATEPLAVPSLHTALPADIVPVGSSTGASTVDVVAQVKAPPPSTDGNRRNTYTLKWELYNKTQSKWLSETTSAGFWALPQQISVDEPTSDQLGLEKFYSYAGKNTGAGGTLMNNLYAGNTIWSYNAFSNPSRGVSTFVRLSYNSLDTSDTVAGFGWSLQASSMMRLGTPLDFHPNPNPNKVTFTDGDGTSHRFTRDDATGQWTSPKGVHLYLEKVTSLDCKPNTQESRAWRLTKPDRTQFYYDCEGFLTSVVDNNGNEMLFTYEERKSNNKPTKFLRYLTDSTGRQTLTIDYYAKGQDYDYIDDVDWTRKSATNLTNPHIIDHVSQITDISGRKLTFTYTDKGLLGEVIDGAGSSQPKVFRFAYDMTQGNKNVKLVKVTDPRGNATDLVYNYPQTGDDPQWHWRTKSYTDRLGHLTQFAYTDPDGTQGNNIDSTVTDAENHATAYRMDGYGRPYQTTNAKNEITKLGWDDDHNVIRLEEANGAVSTWAYDAKTGYPTEIKDAEAVANGTSGTVLTYQRQLNGYVADLTEKTSPEGRKHTFGYESDGDLSWVIDPIGNTTSDPEDYKTSYTYDAWGQMLTATDANGNTTKNDLFDANGYPQKIIDAKTKATTFVYDVRGQVTKVTDAYGKNTTLTYDTFGRPLENRVPKDQATGDIIVTPAPEYDQNDNVVKSYAPNGAYTTASYDKADQLTHTLAPVDQTGDPERKTSFTYDKVGNPLTTTEPKGNLTPTVAGDFVTTNAYDEIYQLISVINAAGHRVTYEYDNVGNVLKVVDPRKNLSTATTDYTTLYDYDSAHRVTKVTDALGKFTMTRYDRDGLVTASTDQLGNTTEVVLDKRGKPTDVKVPHKTDNGVVTHRVTEYEYDEVGNQTRVISPRGVATTDDPDDFATVNVYDELNRVKETRTAYDKDDARYKTADVTTYTYDDVGRLAKVSTPPSAGESVRNDTAYSYFDNGWTKTSSDPWDILTSYDYNKLGAQTARTVTSAGGSSNRTMSWSYFPDGKLASRTDDGVPVGQHVVLADNSDFNNVTTTGTWTAATSATGKYGHNYATHPAGTGTEAFTWQLNVPQAGTYEVFARYPQVTGAATDARYTVKHGGGDTVKTVNQTTGTGTWVSLGSYSFTEGNSHAVSLSDQATGTVVADAVKVVRDNTGETDNEKVDYAYRYDPNGNLTAITDSSPGARVDTYAVAYTGLNQVQTVAESKSGTVKNTTSFTYNENSAPLTTAHDKQYASYAYDERDLVATVVNGKSATDAGKKTTTFAYTDRGEKQKETKGNGNTVDYTYYLDGLLKYQVEKKPNGVVVSEHSMAYDLNGNRISDNSKKMRADDASAYVSNNATYTYDPRDRVVSVNKSGDTPGDETYVHDANNNVIQQTVNNVTTGFNYDRNRLLTATTGGAMSSYNYDPFGRLDTVTAAGVVIEKNLYDGFDHVLENRKKIGAGTTVTQYTYDPMDRTATKTTDAGGAKEKVTTFNYLGLSSEVLDEEVAGELTKSYQYSPWGQRLSQVTHKDDGTEEEAYYGYNPHTDVEQLTDASGNTKATYGYTAYGKDNEAEFTGIDKPDAADPTKEPYNVYRFNAKRWDQASGSYDMGFRDYSPGLNRFLSRDSYNGALSDLKLGLNPWTSNRYAFAGGNPIGLVELDGHTVVPIAPIAIPALGVSAAAAAPLALGAVAVLGISLLAAAAINSDGELTADQKADQAGIHGTEEGAEQAAKLAKELNDTRSPYKAENGTTSVVKVWDSNTGTYKIKVAVEDSGVKDLPEGWEEKIRAVYGNEAAIEFIQNNGKRRKGMGQHAEESIIDSLGGNEVIVEGGASRSVCMHICNAELGPRMELGGQYYVREGGTKFRAFYRPFMPWMSPPVAIPQLPTAPNPVPGPMPGPAPGP
ncbi:DNRLRE domain-containing protein [Micromonospora sp. NPDC049497]|uniref:golvesin C-terminal-like domain-containing protein n=1 Tax=Micromonospora sp. NPDC049497 TaxID=3364273 RepID=UPI00379A9CA0